METISEVLKRFNLSLDLTPELLSLEVEGGYNKYEIEEYSDEEDEDFNEVIKYIFTFDYQRRKLEHSGKYFEYIALLVIFVSDEDCSVGDLIQLAPGLPGVGIYNSNGDCAIT
ncbi:hypothetical protein [Methanobrevibacter wolinii]|uniref:hypothetical protein n=1 Tax=Methanobrevibacter wolinii TaxID=190977 RepID=UPI0005B2D563|nr:hypothetical protein [Methanobrevibacter wolinii]